MLISELCAPAHGASSGSTGQPETAQPASQARNRRPSDRRCWTNNENPSANVNTPTSFGPTNVNNGAENGKGGYFFTASPNLSCGTPGQGEYRLDTGAPSSTHSILAEDTFTRENLSPEAYSTFSSPNSAESQHAVMSGSRPPWSPSLPFGRDVRPFDIGVYSLSEWGEAPGNAGEFVPANSTSRQVLEGKPTRRYVTADRGQRAESSTLRASYHANTVSRQSSKASTPSRTVLSTKRAAQKDAHCEICYADNIVGKRARGASSSSAITLEYACPFYKRNRLRFWHLRSCRTSGWPSVHRVKEHLYRHHMHYTCDRCSAIFKQQDQLRLHLRQEVPCPVRPRDVEEDSGFDQEMEKKLRSRKKIEGMCECAKWAHMFRLLFPSYQNRRTPSPLIDVEFDPRDEQPLPVAPQRSVDTAASTPSAAPPRTVSSPASSTSMMAMMATAAEQQILASENSTGSPLTPGEARRPELHAPEAASRPGPAEMTSATMHDSIRKMVEAEVRAVLSGIPSPTMAPSPAGSASHQETAQMSPGSQNGSRPGRQ